MNHTESLRFLPALGRITLLASALTSVSAGQTVLRTVTGVAADYEYGAAIAPAADWNLDGYADYAVGSPGYLSGFGGVSILSGKYLRTGSGVISLATFNGGGAALGLGVAVCSFGNIAGDTRAELALGAPSFGSGQVEIVAGGSALWTTVNGTGTGSQFGASLAPTGDVNHDGWPDLLVGAPNFDGTGIDKGAAFLLSGKAMGPTIGPLVLHQFDGIANSSRCGAAVAGGADFNNDGYSDLVVASPLNANLGGGADAGLVRVFSGATYAQMWIAFGVTGEHFGASVCVVPDVNGDNVYDLAIGASYSDVGATDGGRVVVYSGASLATAAPVQLVEWTGTTTASHFGTSLADVGDVNDDGKHDIGVGAPDYITPAVGNDNGAVYVFSGATLERLGQWIGASEQHAGIALSSCLDVDQDGADEYLASARHADAAATNNGYVAAIRLFPETPSTYCTGKTNSVGCVESIASSGAPSLTSASAFNVTASGIVNQKNGLLFYGFDTNGAAFQGGTMCVKAPTVRTGIHNSGGSTSGTNCTGTFTFNFNARIQSGVDANLVLGQEVFCQYWSRDPASASTTGLTNALSFLIGP